MNIREALSQVVDGHDLEPGEAREVLDQVMQGQATESQLAGLLVALRMKGETPGEIAGFARAMRENALRVTTERSPLVDTCGTGGDALDTFNISTVAAVVACAAGAAIAKHGNHSMTTQCGSADVLEELGLHIELPPEHVGRCLDEIGIGFLFAPALHPAMRHAAVPRRELGIRTVFNILGPLTNPAGATRQLLGVYDGVLVEPVCRALAELGSEHVLVVHGEPGLDEISTLGATHMAELHQGSITVRTIAPEDLSLPVVSAEGIYGGSAQACAVSMQAVLEGEQGPRRDIVLANAAGALVVADLAEDLRDGITRAAAAIDSGAARQKLEDLRRLSQELSAA